MATQKNTIPALLKQTELEKFNAIYGEENEYVSNYGVSCRDQDSEKGVTVPFFAPSIDIKKSTEALRALIQKGSVFVPNDTITGELELDVVSAGFLTGAYYVETFNLDDGQWKQRPIELIRNTPDYTIFDDEHETDDMIDTTMGNLKVPNKQNKNIICEKSRPSTIRQNICSTPGPRGASRPKINQIPGIYPNLRPEIQVPMGKAIELETGRQTDNIVEVKGSSEWDHGDLSIRAEGPLGKDGRWYPSKIERKHKVVRYDDNVTHVECEDDESDRDDEERVEADYIFDRSNFIDDTYSSNNLGMGKRKSLRKPFKPPKPHRRTVQSIVEEPAGENYGPTTRSKSQGKNVMVVRRQRANDVREEIPYFVCTKPSPQDNVWSYTYRIANDFADHRIFYRLGQDEADVQSVTRVMLRHMVEYGLISNQIRGLRRIASTCNSFQDFITQIIRQTGTIGSITQTLNQLRFDPENDDIFSFLFKIFCYLRLVYDYDQNSEIPKEKIFHHLSMAFTNYVPLRRFFTEVVKYQIMGPQAIDLEKMAENLKSFLDDQISFQKLSPKKKSVSINMIETDTFVGGTRLGQPDYTKPNSTNDVYTSDGTADLVDKPKKNKRNKKKSNSIQGNVDSGSSQNIQTDQCYLRDAVEQMNLLNTQITNKLNTQHSTLLNELRNKSDHMNNIQWHNSLDKILNMQQNPPFSVYNTATRDTPAVTGQSEPSAALRDDPFEAKERLEYKREKKSYWKYAIKRNILFYKELCRTLQTLNYSTLKDRICIQCFSGHRTIDHPYRSRARREEKSKPTQKDMKLINEFAKEIRRFVAELDAQEQNLN